MSLYGADTRGAATRGNFVKVSDGESMQFRIIAVHPVREVDGPNGKYESSPHDVEVAWHRDAQGMTTNPKADDGRPLRWDPAAKNLDGLIKLADSLEKRTGDPAEIMRHWITVKVSQEQNPQSKRWYNVYKFEIAGGQAAPAAPAHNATAPAPSVPSIAPPAPPPPGAGPTEAGAVIVKARMAFEACASIEQLEQAARQIWPEVQASKAAAEATQVFAKRKLDIARGAFGLQIDRAGLDAKWAELSPKFAKDPAALEQLKGLYSARATAIDNNAPTAIEGDLPF